MITRSVLCDHSHPVMMFAAREWRRYVRQITGQSWPFAKHRQTRNGLVLSFAGDDLFHQLPKRVQETVGRIEHDGFAAGVYQQTIYVTAREPRGVLYGVYELLERHGNISFGGPAAGEEYVPKSKIFKVTSPLTVHNPTLPLRSFGFHNEANSSNDAQILNWMAKRKFNTFQMSIPSYKEVRPGLLPEIIKRGLQVHIGCHSALELLKPKVYFKPHPEFFARDEHEKNLERTNLCYSNPDMRQAFARETLALLKRWPETAIVDIWPPDGAPACRCRVCRQAKPDRWLYETTTLVARRVAEEHPKVLVTHLAYSFFTSPPPGASKLPDNVLVQYCEYWDRMHNKPVYDYRQGIVALKSEEEQQARKKRGGHLRNHRDICEELADWRRLCKHLSVFSYYSDLCIKKTITNVAATIQGDIPYYRALNMDGFTDCLCYPARWMAVGLTLFALGDLGWDCRKSLPDIIRRYALGMFGPAAVPGIVKFYQALADLQNEPNWLGFNVLDLVHRDAAEIALFAGIIPYLAEPAQRDYAEKINRLKTVVEELERMKQVNQAEVKELRRMFMHLEWIANKQFALYLAHAFLARGDKTQAARALRNAEQTIQQPPGELNEERFLRFMRKMIDTDTKTIARLREQI